jgi:hypothetical protein
MQNRKEHIPYTRTPKWSTPASFRPHHIPGHSPSSLSPLLPKIFRSPNDRIYHVTGMGPHVIALLAKGLPCDLLLCNATGSKAPSYWIKDNTAIAR